MDQSTFCQQESQEKVRQAKLQKSSATKDLIKIRCALKKISINATQSSYSEMREIRKYFSNLCKMKELFTTVDHQESCKIKNLLQQLKKTHPEICSKDHFVKTDTYKSLVTNSASPFTQPSCSQQVPADTNMSQPVILYPVAEISENNFKKRLKPVSKTSKSKQDKPKVVTSKPSDKLSSPDEVEQKIRQYLIWAVELQNELKKHEQQ